MGKVISVILGVIMAAFTIAGLILYMAALVVMGVSLACFIIAVYVVFGIIECVLDGIYWLCCRFSLPARWVANAQDRHLEEGKVVHSTREWARGIAHDTLGLIEVMWYRLKDNLWR